MESIYCRTTPKSGIVAELNRDFEMSSTLEKARRNIKIAGIFTVLSLGMVASNNNKAYAKTPFDNDIELVTDDPAPKADPQANKQTAQLYNYLAEGKSTEEGIDFIKKYGAGMPFCIYLETNDLNLVNNVRALLNKMDDQGYENMYLMVVPLSAESKADGFVSKMDFLANGTPKKALGNMDKNWFYGDIKENAQGQYETVNPLWQGKDGSYDPLPMIRVATRVVHPNPPNNATLSYVNEKKPQSSFE